MKVAISPLVSRQVPTQDGKFPHPLIPSTAMVAAASSKTPLANSAAGLDNMAEDVSSPAAAKARTTLVNSSFVPNIKTPVSQFRKAPQIPLQKAVLLSAGELNVLNDYGMWKKEEGDRQK